MQDGSRQTSSGEENKRGLITELKEGELAEIECKTREVAAKLAVEQISEIGSRDDVVVRDMHPHLDLQSGADNAWNGDDHAWVQEGLTADQNNEVYTIDSEAKADKKVMVVYAISHIGSTALTSTISFRTNDGGLFEFVQAQGMLADEEVTAAFVRPVWFDADWNGTIHQWATGSGDDELVYHGIVAEQAGRTLSPRKS